MLLKKLSKIMQSDGTSRFYSVPAAVSAIRTDLHVEKAT